MNANTLSGILFFVAYVPYLLAIVQRETVPSPVSWIIWACVDTLTFLAMRKANAPTGQIKGTVAGAWVIVLLSLYYGSATMGTIEWVSIVGGVTGIALWKKTRKPVLAIICAQVATFLGSLPTIANAYQNPSQESALAWSIWLASCICALFAVKKWDIEQALQPLTFTLIEATMVFLVVIRPHLSF